MGGGALQGRSPFDRCGKGPLHVSGTARTPEAASSLHERAWMDRSVDPCSVPGLVRLGVLPAGYLAGAVGFDK